MGFARRSKPYKLFPHGFELLAALETRFLKISVYLVRQKAGSQLRCACSKFPMHHNTFDIKENNNNNKQLNRNGMMTKKTNVSNVQNLININSKTFCLMNENSENSKVFEKSWHKKT